MEIIYDRALNTNSSQFYNSFYDHSAPHVPGTPSKLSVHFKTRTFVIIRNNADMSATHCFPFLK